MKIEVDNNDIIIEWGGKRYRADDDNHELEIGEDDTGAELVVEKYGCGCFVVQLKKIEDEEQ